MALLPVFSSGDLQRPQKKKMNKKQTKKLFSYWSPKIDVSKTVDRKRWAANKVSCFGSIEGLNLKIFSRCDFKIFDIITLRDLWREPEGGTDKTHVQSAKVKFIAAYASFWYPALCQLLIPTYEISAANPVQWE